MHGLPGGCVLSVGECRFSYRRLSLHARAATSEQTLAPARSRPASANCRAPPTEAKIGESVRGHGLLCFSGEPTAEAGGGTGR